MKDANDYQLTSIMGVLDARSCGSVWAKAVGGNIFGSCSWCENE
jgi:hypothetical protein